MRVIFCHNVTLYWKIKHRFPSSPPSAAFHTFSPSYEAAYSPQSRPQSPPPHHFHVWPSPPCHFAWLCLRYLADPDRKKGSEDIHQPPLGATGYGGVGQGQEPSTVCPPYNPHESPPLTAITGRKSAATAISRWNHCEIRARITTLTYSHILSLKHGRC